MQLRLRTSLSAFRSMSIQLLATSSIFVFGLSCGGGSSEGQHSPPAAPVIASFSAVQSTVTSGTSTMLTAAFTGGTGVIDNGVGTVTSGTSITTGILAAATTFTLTVNGDGGTITGTVTVAVAAAPQTPVITAPSTLMAGQGGYTASVPLQSGMTFNWTISGGTITAGSGNAQVVFTANSAGTLQLGCQAVNGTGTSSGAGAVSIPVIQGPTIGTFQANPTTITAGQPSTLSWAVSGATSLSIDSGVGTVTGTSIGITPAGTTTYTLTATNTAGSVTKTATITVIPQGQKPVITSFTTSPATVAGGQSCTLSWSVAWAASLSIDNGIGAVTGSTVTVNPTATTTYTLTAINANGTTTATAMVTFIAAGQLPIITTFVATPANINSGQSSVLSWSVSDATALTLNNGIGAVTGTTSSVSPTSTTTYTLTATNSTGSSTATATVIVGNLMRFTLPGGVALDLVSIPAGTFTMGSVNTVDAGAQPPFRVTLSKSYFMCKVEITQEQYQAVTGVNPSFWIDPLQPVSGVSWNDINQNGGFLSMLNSLAASSLPSGLVFRLPTEAEYEYACRAGSITEWFFGNDPTILGNYAWCAGNSNHRPNEVGLKLPNSFGLFDMTGNIFEWCQDYAGDYQGNAVTDPIGPSSGVYRILRGTSENGGSDNCRSAYRSFDFPSNNQSSQVTGSYVDFYGFRVVLAVPWNL